MCLHGLGFKSAIASSVVHDKRADEVDFLGVVLVELLAKLICLIVHVTVDPQSLIRSEELTYNLSVVRS